MAKKQFSLDNDAIAEQMSVRGNKPVISDEIDWSKINQGVTVATFRVGTIIELLGYKQATYENVPDRATGTTTTRYGIVGVFNENGVEKSIAMGRLFQVLPTDPSSVSAETWEHIKQFKREHAAALQQFEGLSSKEICDKILAGGKFEIRDQIAFNRLVRGGDGKEFDIPTRVYALYEVK